jgi:predicted nucleotidyltransferase component of viral defense system
MVDINKHKFFLFQILKDIYEDRELAVVLGFKGGTALMFFYDLPRFSVDLDFNLLNPDKEDVVYGKILRDAGKLWVNKVKCLRLRVVLL